MTDTFVPPAKGQSAPSDETDTIKPPENIAVQGIAARPVRWGPDLDQIIGDVQKINALLPPDTEVPPLVKDFESPVFWATTIVPIVLAVVAYCFHHDLGQEATSIAALGAAITTLGYTIYRAVYRHTHSVALTAAAMLATSKTHAAIAVATGQPIGSVVP